MLANDIPIELAGRVTPRALRTYATSLGFEQLPGVNGKILVYHRPENRAVQLIVPLDPQLDDYADMVAQAVVRIAEFDRRSYVEVLDHLLLPPADVLQFQDTSADAQGGSLAFDHAVELVAGIKKALLAQAHSVLKPQPYHPRLSRGEADQFLDACRFGQTRRGSFILTLACPLNAVPTEDQFLEHQSPFARQVTTSLMQTLSDIAAAAERQDIGDLLSPAKYPLMNANFCEALTLMKPRSNTASLQIAATWSRALSPPDGTKCPSAITFDSECFAVAEAVAPALRKQDKPEKSAFVGFVDVLRGTPGPDNRPSGEVVLSLLIGDESLRARAELSADQYQTANTSHMQNAPILVRGELHRLPRLNRVKEIESIMLVAGGERGHDA